MLWLLMAILLSTDARQGLLTLHNIDPGELQDELVLTLPIDRADLQGRDPVAVRVKLEQSPDGSIWWPIGSFTTHDILSLRDKQGNPLDVLTARFKEQIYRHDIYIDQGFDRWGGATWEIKDDATGGHYWKLAFNRRLRITVDAFHANARGEKIDDARLVYGAEVVFAKGPQPAPIIGRRSASLLGLFAAAESSTGSATSGSRTTTSGSLITNEPAAWNGATFPTFTESDDKSNTYTEHWDQNFEESATERGGYALASNLGGTRGASHEVTATTTGGSGMSLGGQEWDGIAAGPVVTTGTVATGTSTDPTCSVTPSGGASLVIGQMIYNGAPKTFTVDNGTEAQEIDENNTRQAQGVAYKVAASGSTSISWLLSGTEFWSCRAIAFEEAAGVAAPILRDRAHQPQHQAIMAM